MDEAALPFDEHDIVVLILQDQLFGGSADEVSHNAIDRQSIAFDHAAGLTGGDEFGVVTALLHAIGHLDRNDHLADRTIVADGVHPQAIGPQSLAAGDCLLGVFANVVNRRAALPG